jgi:hypothetical protein
LRGWRRDEVLRRTDELDALLNAVSRPEDAGFDNRSRAACSEDVAWTDEEREFARSIEEDADT